MGHNFKKEASYIKTALKQILIGYKALYVASILAWILISFYQYMVALLSLHSCQTNILPKSNLLSVWSPHNIHTTTHAPKHEIAHMLYTDTSTLLAISLHF